MRAEIDHRRARVESSARWDDEHDPRLASLVDEHVAGCPGCRAALTKMEASRHVLRLQPASAPPDLTSSIMREIAPVRSARRSTLWRERLTVAAVAAAVSALVLAGASLPWDTTSELANAAEVSLEIRQAARNLDGYSATYSLTETGWHEGVPVRTFTAEVDYRAPEELRVRIDDTTEYPSGEWPRNDVVLAASARRWWIKEPTTCPPEALPGCSARGSESRALSARAPFDGDTLPPTDIVVPLESLASSGGFEVVAAETVAGRDVYRLELDHLAAEPLIAALQPGGTWARFEPDDLATIWVDRKTWFPVALRVSSRTSETRFEARLEELHEVPQLGVVPRKAMVVNRGSFTDTALNVSWEPAFTRGLQPYRSGRSPGSVVISYASGLTWLKVVKDEAPDSVALVSDEVAIGTGTGYYLPADERGARRVDLFVRDERFRIESNLARRDLVRVAGSMPIVGRAISGRSSTTPASFGKVAWLPAGYELASVVRAGLGSLSAYFRHPEIERADFGVRVTYSPDRTVLTPSSEEFVLVDVGGRPGRWSAERGELEWLQGGYRAVAAPGLGLRAAVRIAESWLP